MNWRREDHSYFACGAHAAYRVDVVSRAYVVWRQTPDSHGFAPLGTARTLFEAWALAQRDEEARYEEETGAG